MCQSPIPIREAERTTGISQGLPVLAIPLFRTCSGDLVGVVFPNPILGIFSDSRGEFTTKARFTPIWPYSTESTAPRVRPNSVSDRAPAVPIVGSRVPLQVQ
jgi:hypothetical protein